MSIVAKELTFIYNPNTPFAKKAVDNVNVTINDGEFIAIVGHTGSGKTTFLQHLNALIRVQSGTLDVNGLHVADKKVDLKKEKAAKKADVSLNAKYVPEQLKLWFFLCLYYVL